MKNRYVLLLVLVAYVVFLFYLTVLSRESSQKCTIRLDLFNSFLEVGRNRCRDLIQNVVGFMPMGVLVGILSSRHRVVKALLAGLLMSLMIESSQLIWKRGVFDVDDLVNNAVGAVIGGIVWAAIKSLGNGRNKEMRIFSQREKH